MGVVVEAGAVAAGAGHTPEVERALGARGCQVKVADGGHAQVLELAAAGGDHVAVLFGRLTSPTLRAVADLGRVTDAGARGAAVLVVGPLRPTHEVLVALASGVRGYLPTPSSLDEVVDGVLAVGAGEVVAPSTVVRSLIDQLVGGRGICVDVADGSRVELTRREWDVLVLLRQGYTTTEIATGLVVSPVTVRTHVAALVRKMGVGDRAAFVED